MKRDFLFPHSWRVPGWILAAVFGIFGILWICEAGNIADWLGGYMDEAVTIGLMAGLLLVAFSRERDEDEYTTRIRASSLVWAVFADSILVVLATLFIYNFAYLYVMIMQLFLLLALYIVKFRTTLYKVRRESRHAEVR